MIKAVALDALRGNGHDLDVTVWNNKGAGMDSPAQSGMESLYLARTRPRSLPCSQACTGSDARSGTDSGMETATELPTRSGRCPRGFSMLQIAVLGVLRAHQQVIAYWQIAQLIVSGYGLKTTEGAVRGTLERLFRRGFIVRRRAANGQMQGNRYAFSADPCPHIRAYAPGMESVVNLNVESAAQSGENAAPSILKEKTDRKNLSISSGEDESRKAVQQLGILTEDDIAFHWPAISRQGFSTDQIRQILQRLSSVNIGAERIIQGLTHAEWELSNDKMRDKSNTPIANPVSWVFKILATQGYYPRPEGYISPQEQAEQDAAEEAKRMQAASETRQTAVCDAWIAGLSPEERASILEPKNNGVRIPESIALRLHFRTAIWPKMQNGEAI